MCAARPLINEYTLSCIRALKPGSKAVFTQPPLPFKCPGAPQKIVYLTADHLKRNGLRPGVELRYFVHAPVIFGVPFFARELVKVAANHGVDVNFQHNLVAIDAKAKTATFEIVGGQGEKIDVACSMSRRRKARPTRSRRARSSTPPEVNQNSMQHVRYPNVFGLGDACSTPNSKTAAAVRKQAPVVVRNILRAMKGEAADAGCDGYASTPARFSNGRPNCARRDC